MLVIIISLLGGFIGGVVTEKAWRWWSAHRLWQQAFPLPQPPLHQNTRCEIIPFPGESIGGGDA